jgi:hypothetical protein
MIARPLQVNSQRVCDCGALATRSVTVQIISPEGNERPVSMALCPDCYREHLAVELSLAQARCDRERAQAILKELYP